MNLVERRLYGTTAAGGTATITDPDGGIFGVLYAVAWIDGTLADNNTAVLSTINHEAASTLLTLAAGEGDDDVIYYPRAVVHDAGATALTGTAGGDRTCPIVAGTLQLAIAAGGSLNSGGCLVYVDTDV